MEKSNTREEILEAALDLFSVGGYEATSISQLASKTVLIRSKVFDKDKRDVLYNY